MAFADIGKAYKDVSSGFVYDHKAAWSTKTGFGALSGSATYVVKDGSVPVEAKGTYKLGSASSLEASVTDKGKVTAVLVKDDLAKGLKAKLTAVLAGGSNDASLALGYSWATAPLVGGKLGATCDLGLSGAKAGKLVGSAGWAQGSLTLGGEAEYDNSKGAVSKYTLGAQASLSNGGTAAALLADKAQTLRVSYVHKCSATVNGGLEATHSLKTGDTSVAMGSSFKMASASAKAHVTQKGIVSLLYARDVQPNKATATLCLQVDAFNPTAAPKVGVQLAIK